MRNWNACVVASVVCRFLGILAILAFVALMVVFTGKLACLWLLFLLFAVEFIPTYEVRSNYENKTDIEKENK